MVVWLVPTIALVILNPLLPHSSWALRARRCHSAMVSKGEVSDANSSAGGASARRQQLDDQVRALGGAYTSVDAFVQDQLPASRQPKQRRSEESTFERNIKSNIQSMQDSIRKVSEKLEQAQRSFFSKRVEDSLERCLEQSHKLARETEQLFREWQVHLADEPAERHRKKFSIEKLQKAFDEEAAHLKEVAQRAKQTQQEAIAAGNCGLSSSGGVECYSMCDEQDEDDDCERGLLDDSTQTRDQTCMLAQEQDAAIRNQIAVEREEGIKRIQCQVSEVNQIFRDLASIVTDQGQQIGSIESQAETTASSTQQAVQELKKAVDRQRGAREKLCCLLATVILFLCFIILPQMHVLAFHPYSTAGGSLVAQTNAAGQPGGSPAAEPAAGRAAGDRHRQRHSLGTWAWKRQTTPLLWRGHTYQGSHESLRRRATL